MEISLCTLTLYSLCFSHRFRFLFDINDPFYFCSRTLSEVLLAHAQALETVGQEELEMLHSEAVMAGTAGDDNVWFKAIDAR
jgi:hypothetical protein